MYQDPENGRRQDKEARRAALLAQRKVDENKKEAVDRGLVGGMIEPRELL
jgi:hypothetical protein